MKTIIKKIHLWLLVILLSGCVTATGGVSEESARQQNALTGAQIACDYMPMFGCLLIFPSVIGYFIGKAMPVEP